MGWDANDVALLKKLWADGHSPGQIAPLVRCAPKPTAEPAARINELHQPFQPDLGRPDCAARIFRFSFPPNQLHLRATPPHRRGAYASSRYVECGLRWTRWRCAREASQGGLKLCLGAVSDRSAQDERRSSRTAKACGSGTRGWCQIGGG